MANLIRARHALALNLLFAPISVLAQGQLTDLPNLPGSTTSSAASTTSASSEPGSTTGPSATTTGGSSSSFYSLPDLPTSIGGATVPTLAIPNTSNAPYMQKSNLPEGTVFIAIGAILAFLGASVLLWRMLVAWSVTRSVRRVALAATRSEKHSSTWGGYTSHKNSQYREFGSNLSLDALNSAGKPVRPHFRDNHDSTFSHSHQSHPSSTSNAAAPPPAGLFFSPTAHAQNRRSMYPDSPNRSSTFLPAGYYASAAAPTPTGHTTLGRASAYEPSPPTSPGLRPHSAVVARDGYGYANPRDSSQHLAAAGLYAQPSRSSLLVGGYSVNSSNSDLPESSRAPSAYLDEMFDGRGERRAER